MKSMFLPGPKRLAAVVLALACLGVGGAAFGACHDPVQPFQCGVPLANDGSATRACTGPNEVCVCWTHYCARKQPPHITQGEPGYCDSGLRYRTEPFGPDSDAEPIEGVDTDLGECVPKELADWQVRGTALCDAGGSGGTTSTDTGNGGGGKGGAQ